MTIQRRSFEKDGSDGVFPKWSGSWKERITEGKRSAAIRCPGCGEIGSLGSSHVVGDDGVVNPSVVCGCGFHEWIRLEDWADGICPKMKLPCTYGCDMECFLQD